MSEAAAPASPARLDAVWALVIMLAVQTMVALLGACIPLLAPTVAAAHGWSVDVIALYAPLTYTVAFVLNFKMPWLLARFGGMGLSLVCIAACALGLLCLVPAFAGVALLLPLMFGLAVAAMNPASAQVLAPRTSTRSASLVMSIKQMGIPLGAILAGLVVPLLLARGSWRMSIIDLAFLSAAMIVVFAPSVRWLNGVGAPSAHGYRPLEPAKQLLAIPGMGMMVLAAAVFSVMQICLRTFLPVYLVKDLHLSLALTGFVFSASQAAGVIGQLGWAAMSDRLFAPYLTMSIMGLVMAAAAFLSAMFTPAWPVAAIVAVSMAFGVGVGGFGPVVLGEIARRAAPEKAGVLTGGLNLFLFVGVVAGPLVFGVITSAADYSSAFIVMGALTLVVSLAIGRFERRDRQNEISSGAPDPRATRQN
jgi:MFS family permease